VSCTPHKPAIPGDEGGGLNDAPPSSDHPGRPFSSGANTRAFHYRHCLGWTPQQIKAQLVSDGFGALFPDDFRPPDVTDKIHNLVNKGKLAARRAGYCPHPYIELGEEDRQGLLETRRHLARRHSDRPITSLTTGNF
jgi:hypothetical protein